MENSNCMKMMKDVSALFRKNIDNALKEENITMTQLGRLQILRDEFGGECDYKSLEKALLVAQSTAVTLFSRLEAKGLIECFSDSGDRRVKKMRMTQGARNLCDRIESTRTGFGERAMEGITREEKAFLEELLLRVYKNVVNGTRTLDSGAMDA